MCSKLSPRRLRSLEHELEALKLRLEGCTFQQIADRLRYAHRASAWRAIDRARTIRLLELGALVQRLTVADSRRQLARVERRISTLNAGVRHGMTCRAAARKGGRDGKPSELTAR